ncbi:MAG: lysylphosphatidylglycerol synthase domain-containing protein [Thermoanaerobaculia bacterium]
MGLTATTAASPRPRAARFGLLLLGLAVLAAVFWKAGWSDVSANLERVGWWFPVVLILWTLPMAASVEGWRQVVSPRPALRLIPDLFAAFLAGETANFVGAGVAGEPLRALLVREHLGSAEAFASAALRKHAELAAQVLFLVLGTTASLLLFPIPAVLAVATALGVAAMGAGLLLMTWALRRGSLAPLIGRLAGWKFLASRLERFREPAVDVDLRIRLFYGASPGRFAASAGWAFLAWSFGVFETWFLLRLLGTGAGWAEALAIECLTMTLNTMLLIIPGRLGSAEAIRTVVLVALGLTAPVGAAYALLRRGREIVWMLPGAVTLLRRHALSLL